MTACSILGVLIIIFTLSFGFWRSTSGKKIVIGIYFLAVIAGILLMVVDRITEIPTPWGSFKSIAQKAAVDIREITRLRERIEGQSATVDMVAKEASDTKHLVEDFSRKNIEAEKKLAQFDVVIHEKNKEVEELLFQTKFNATVLAAQNDDRKAYDQLWVWANTPSFPLAQKAIQAVETIMDQHNSPIVIEGFSVPWNPSVAPQKLTLPELWQVFQSAPPQIRLGILEFVWKKRTDISKYQRLQYLATVLRSDTSLKVIECAGRFFQQGTGNQLKPLAINPHLEWWNKNKDLLKDKA